MNKKSSKKKKNGSLIKVLGPSVSQAEIKAVTRVLKSGWWGIGPETELFENEFAKFVGSKHAIAVNSCTSALHLSLHLLEKKGEIIVPALTFISPALVGVYENQNVVFADVDESTYCVDQEDVTRKITQKTTAIIPVHYAGKLADLDYKERGVPIIEDCAHAAGTKGAGLTGIFGCWCFAAVKNIATGDGGMITTNDGKIAERLRKLRWFGITQSTWERTQPKYSWEYDISEIGYKYHLNDILSAIGRIQLKRLKKLNKKRKEIADIYHKELSGLPITLPPASGSWHLYAIRVDKRLRNKLIDFLKKRNISTSVHYKPLYNYPIFKWNIKERGKSLPVTEKLSQELISLPMYPDLAKGDLDRVVSSIKEFFMKIA